MKKFFEKLAITAFVALMFGILALIAALGYVLGGIPGLVIVTSIEVAVLVTIGIVDHLINKYNKEFPELKF